VQATLLALYKTISNKPVKKGKDPDPNGLRMKALYGESLKTGQSNCDIILLLTKVKNGIN